MSDNAAPGAPDLAPDSTVRVVVLDGVYHLQLTSELALPFMQHGAPLRNLGAGWHYHTLYLTFAPVLLFELRHDSGERATWFFDSTPTYIANAVANLPLVYRTILIDKASIVLRGLLATLLGDATPNHTDDASDFFTISAAARHQIGTACRENLIPAAALVELSEVAEPLLLRPRGPVGPLVLMARAALAVTLTEDFQARLIAALDDGYLRWPSPIDGRYQTVTASLVFNDFDFAYRIEEPTTGLVYFLLATEHLSTVCGIYMPTANLLVAKAGHVESVRNRFIGISVMIMDHVCHYGATLLPYLQHAPKRMAAFMREQHIGHQLWNELTGLNTVVEANPPVRPEVLVLGGRGAEFFGPLDQIFPELAGRTRPEIATFDEVLAHSHAHHLVVGRFTANFVSKRLRDRILTLVRTTDESRAAVDLRSRRRGLSIVLGLRVENRTAVNLSAVLCRLVDHIARIAPGSHIVLDGQNRRAGEGFAPIGSFGDTLAKRSPIDAEISLCIKIASSAADKPVTVATTSGETVATSMAWIDAADCFIAFWGAGMAKYRWIANKPGLVVTSRYHLLNPGEMMIYQSPVYMEEPAPIRYIEPTCVDDDPDADQLVPVAGPRHASFRVDEVALFATVDAFLAPFMARRS